MNKKGMHYFIMIMLVAAAVSCSQKPGDKAKNSIVTYKWAAAEAGLKMRALPNTTADQVALIPLNEKLVVTGQSANEETIMDHKGFWLEVEWNGKKGWVFGGFTSDTEPANEAIDNRLFQGEWSSEDPAGDTAFIKYIISDDGTFSATPGTMQSGPTLDGLWSWDPVKKLLSFTGITHNVPGARSENISNHSYKFINKISDTQLEFKTVEGKDPRLTLVKLWKIK